jgi:hypothetical protein
MKKNIVGDGNSLESRWLRVRISPGASARARNSKKTLLVLGSFFIHWELLHIDNEGERSENAQHHSLNKVHLIQSPSIHYKQLIPLLSISFQQMSRILRITAQSNLDCIPTILHHQWELTFPPRFFLIATLLQHPMDSF